MTMEEPQKTAAIQIAEVQELKKQILLHSDQVAALSVKSTKNPKATSKYSVLQVSAAWPHTTKLSIKCKGVIFVVRLVISTAVSIGCVRRG